jgi:urate oxidase
MFPTLTLKLITRIRYTEADNSVVVATDTQKQTCYILAKQNPVTPLELFASIIGDHFVKTYSHIHAAHIKIIQQRWARMTVDGKPHPHSFYRDSEETREVELVAREGKGISIKSGVNKLLVLKSTGSAFYGFHRDAYTQLPEVWDRILSTEVECGWHWKTFASLDEVRSNIPKFDDAWNKVRTITMSTFATDNSASVQNTMYKMSDQILAAVPFVNAVDYSLPNKHYFEIGMFTSRVLIHVHTNDSRRLELAQGTKEYRQRCRSLCPSVQPERSHSMYRYSQECNSQVVEQVSF